MKSLRESMTTLGTKNGGKSPVDRARRVIYGVKIVGKFSRNGKKGRRYTDECLKSARRLYEGLTVRVNHPRKRDQGEDRPAEDILGQLRNVRYTPDGLRGDLRYFADHPMTARLIEAAEDMPTAFGLSHNVDEWEGHYDSSGVYVVTEISKVASVDLVSDPGSTRGLFESHRKGKPMKKPKVKLSAWVGKQQGPIQAAFKKLLESDMVPGSTLLASEEDPMAAVGGAFNSAIMAVVTGSADTATKLQKIGVILKSQDDLVASGAFTPTDPPEEVDESDDEGGGNDDDSNDDNDPKKDEVVESLRQEVQALKRRDECRRLCESMGVVPTAVQLKALERLDTEAERKTFLRESVSTGGRGSSGSAGGGRRTGEGPRDAKEFASRIRR